MPIALFTPHEKMTNQRGDSVVPRSDHHDEPPILGEDIGTTTHEIFAMLVERYPGRALSSPLAQGLLDYRIDKKPIEFSARGNIWTRIRKAKDLEHPFSTEEARKRADSSKRYAHEVQYQKDRVPPGPRCRSRFHHGPIIQDESTAPNVPVWGTAIKF